MNKEKLKYYCIDCGKKIHWQTALYGKKRCQSCSNKGKNNGNYIDGKSLKKYYCKICEKEINWHNVIYGQGKCASCAGKLHSIRIKGNYFSYIDGRTLKKHFCIDCREKISYSNWKYGNQKCSFCSHKGKNNAMYGIRGRLHPRFGKVSHGKHIKYKNIWMLSTWEYKFAFFLDCSGINWQYEPKAFDLRNTTYTPDFYIPEWNCYIEIKGWWRDDAKKKFGLFRYKYPKKNIKVLMEKDLQQLGIL